MTPQTRLLAMFAGWILAFYGVSRRSWPGTMIVMAGISMAEAAIAIGEPR